MILQRLFYVTLLALLVMSFSKSDAMASVAFEKYRESGLTVIHAEQAEPHFFKSHDGAPQGVLADFWNLWSLKTGIPVHFEMVAWPETLSRVVEGKADVHAGLVKLQDRLPLFEFSDAIYAIKGSLLVRGNKEVDKEEVYKNFVIGAVTNSHSAKLVYDNYPAAQVLEYETPLEVVEALARGEVYAVSMDLPMFYFNNAKLDKPIEVTACDTLFVNYLHAGVAKGNAELAAVVNAGFGMIAPSEKDVILNRWLIGYREENSWRQTTTLIAASALIVGFSIFYCMTSSSRRTKGNE